MLKIVFLPYWLFDVEVRPPSPLRPFVRKLITIALALGSGGTQLAYYEMGETSEMVNGFGHFCRSRRETCV